MSSTSARPGYAPGLQGTSVPTFTELVGVVRSQYGFGSSRARRLVREYMARTCAPTATGALRHAGADTAVLPPRSALRGTDPTGDTAVRNVMSGGGANG